jgi:hypothetical protein
MSRRGSRRCRRSGTSTATRERWRTGAERVADGERSTGGRVSHRCLRPRTPKPRSHGNSCAATMHSTSTTTTLAVRWPMGWFRGLLGPKISRASCLHDAGRRRVGGRAPAAGRLAGARPGLPRPLGPHLYWTHGARRGLARGGRRPFNPRSRGETRDEQGRNASGAYRDRTGDLQLAKLALSQLS